MNGAWDLVWKASGRCNPQVAYYDAGFDSERFHAFHRVGWGVGVCGKGVVSYIKPVIKTEDGTIRSPYRSKCVRMPKSYGRRWCVESFFSAMKRICGQGVRSIKPANQLAEAAMKVLAYGFRR